MASYKQAVRAMCKQCIYDPVGGTGSWVEQVTNCTDIRCALYSVRPISSGGRVDIKKLVSNERKARNR